MRFNKNIVDFYRVRPGDTFYYRNAECVKIRDMKVVSGYKIIWANAVRMRDKKLMKLYDGFRVKLVKNN